MAGRSGGYGWQPRQRISDEETNAYLRDRLRDYNQRDSEAIKQHIRGLRDALERTDNNVLPTRFGGSVSRHTYVDGLSDVDVLLMVNESSLSGQAPEAVIRRMAELIQQRLPKTKVRIGNLAVTVSYSDGHEIQILPAVQTQAGVKIADPSHNRWSSVLHPEKFAQKLTEVNQANQGQVIPAIKVTKALSNHVIRSERDKITGYHMDSLAIGGIQKLPRCHRPEEHGESPDALLFERCSPAHKGFHRPVQVCG